MEEAREEEAEVVGIYRTCKEEGPPSQESNLPDRKALEMARAPATWPEILF